MFFKKETLGLIGSVTLSIIFVVLFRMNFLLVEIPSGSMQPTLGVGDLLICRKVKDTATLERGDIVVFDSDELGKLLVKRLIGLPGEVVDLRDGAVFIDGEKLIEDYVVFPDSENNKTFEVPEDSFLFLGDNRKQSNDARYWSEPYIDKSMIRARVKLRYFPSSRIGSVN